MREGERSVELEREDKAVAKEKKIYFCPTKVCGLNKYASVCLMDSGSSYGS